MAPDGLEKEKLGRLLKCVSCGKCLVECPVYSATKETRHLPLPKSRLFRHIFERTRGKVARLKGVQPIEEYVFKRAVPTLYECTLCGSCTEQCKFEVKPHELWYDFRHVMNALNKIPPALKEAREAIKNDYNPYGMNNETRMDWVDYLGLEEAPVKEKAKIAYFVGCTESFKSVAQDMAYSTALILNSLKLDWTFLGVEQWCCGGPSLMIGDVGTAKKLAEHNVNLIESRNVEVLVVTCATCYRFIKREYEELIGRKPKFKVMHGVELVLKLVEEGKIKLKQEGEVIGYHDPCELARLGGVIEEPRKILMQLSTNYVELGGDPGKGTCCGGGGFLQATNNEVRLKVAQVRVGQAKQRGVEVLVSACPSCKMSLIDGKREAGLNLQVKDIMELLAEKLNLI